MASVGDVKRRKRERRTRAELVGVDRDCQGRIKRPSVAVPVLPTPEQDAKRDAQGLQRGDALDCQVTRLFRAGLLSQSEHDAAKTVERAYRAYVAAVCSPRLASGGAGGSGGNGNTESDKAAMKAWRDIEAALIIGSTGHGDRAITHTINLCGRGGVLPKGVSLDGVRACLDRIASG